jgi:hypothetical protein
MSNPNLQNGGKKPLEALAYRQITFHGDGTALLRVEIGRSGSDERRLGGVPKSIDVQSLKIISPDNLFIARKRFVSLEEMLDIRTQKGQTIAVSKGGIVVRGVLLALGDSLLTLETGNGTIVDGVGAKTEVRNPDFVQYNKDIGAATSYLEIELRSLERKSPALSIETIALSGTMTPPTKPAGDIEMGFKAQGFSWEVSYQLTLDFQKLLVHSLICEVTFQNRTDVSFGPSTLAFLAKADERPRVRSLRGDYQMAAMAAPPSGSEETSAGSALFTLGTFPLPALSSQTNALFQSSSIPFLSILTYDISRRGKHPERLVQFHPPRPPVGTNGDGTYPGGKVFIWEKRELLAESSLAMQKISDVLRSPFTFSLGEHAFINVDTEISKTPYREFSGIRSNDSGGVSGREERLAEYEVNIKIVNRTGTDYFFDAYYPSYNEIRKFQASARSAEISVTSPLFELQRKGDNWYVEPDRYGYHVFVVIQKESQASLSLQFVSLD